jgi:hypothetical protein
MSEPIDFTAITRDLITSKRRQDEQDNNHSAMLAAAISEAKIELAPVLTYISQTLSQIDFSKSLLLAKQEGLFEEFLLNFRNILTQRVEGMFFESNKLIPDKTPIQALLHALEFEVARDTIDNMLVENLSNLTPSEDFKLTLQFTIDTANLGLDTSSCIKDRFDRQTNLIADQICLFNGFLSFNTKEITTMIGKIYANTDIVGYSIAKALSRCKELVLQSAKEHSELPPARKKVDAPNYS